MWNTPAEHGADPNDQPAERRGLMSGRWVLIVAAMVVALVIGVAWVAVRYSASVMQDEPPLSWANRADWSHRPVNETSLRASGIRTLFTGDEWRELSLSVPEGEVRAVQELAALAESAGFDDEATRDRIETIRAERPEVFYATYLLGTWHRVRGDASEADALYEQAFAEAPAAIRQAYITEDYRRLPDLAVGRIEVVCYRASGDTVDDSLRLVYPAMVTDERGFIAMPVYKTVCAVTGRVEPEDLATRHADLDAFQFPGRIGTLPSVTVTLQDGQAAEATGSE